MFLNALPSIRHTHSYTYVIERLLLFSNVQRVILHSTGILLTGENIDVFDA